MSATAHPLATAVLEALAADPTSIARLRELVGLDVRAARAAEGEAPAYTVASLAAAVGVTPKVVRGAITRGELGAAKRGGRWIIPAAAVRAWATPDVPALTDRRRARRPAPGPLTAALASFEDLATQAYDQAGR